MATGGKSEQTSKSGLSLYANLLGPSTGNNTTTTTKEPVQPAQNAEDAAQEGSGKAEEKKTVTCKENEEA